MLAPIQSTSPANEDRETLKGMFCMKLPGAEESLPASQYWEKDIIPLALQRRLLMCGLLAIYAYHSATFEDETTTRKIHRERATKFNSEFFAGFNMITNDDTNTMATDAFQKANKAGIQIRSILNCTQWT
ncbi:hypothetical protein N7481_011164 [Penicillium waksmanii]|uniref:uncharacterized protein n=1 Tax=Penicillium waksmanii TaxID=69791 RepID=UPI002546C97C|nr:uncharacterized protein N7481_011164 [Penicillium waksmanii]KAJ5973954.1 hypothetical protein N7481_011164 [Penicillium waksmanii]